MPVNLISEVDLRAVLRSHRVDPKAFETAVRGRLQIDRKKRADDPLAGLSPFARAAAAMIPLQILTGGKVAGAATPFVPMGFGYKLLGYLTFPAIFLFVLVGASIFSWSKIRKIQGTNNPDLDSEQVVTEGIMHWWRDHRRGVILVIVLNLVLPMIGSTWLFLFYIVSLGLLLCVLASFSKRGLGNRKTIGQCCAMGLMFLAQTAMFPGVGSGDIHFVDQALVAVVLCSGTMILLGFNGGRRVRSQRIERIPQWLFVVLATEIVAALCFWFIYPGFTAIPFVATALVCESVLLIWANLRHRIHGQPIAWVCQPKLMVGYIVVAIPLTVWGTHSILSPVTPAQIKQYVETFDNSPFESASWHEWEIPARWAIDSNLDPDLTKPRQLLQQVVNGGQNSYVLGTGFRVGMIEVNQIDRLSDYQKQLYDLLDDSDRLQEKSRILSLEQRDWVIRAAVLRHELSPESRDYLKQRLNVSMEYLENDEYQRLEDVLRITELLQVIDRPIDRDRYRSQVHDWLRKHHCTKSGLFRIGDELGGFKTFAFKDTTWASMDSTSHAIQLMAIYGIPDGLDLNWVRSYLRVNWRRDHIDPDDRTWMAAATLDRLNHLPGVTHPSWFKVLYCECNLLAAMVLVAMCLFATFSSPVVESRRERTLSMTPTDESI